MNVGEVWLAEHWAVLVLEVRDKPPEEQRQFYLAHRSGLAARMAEAPHAFCLVLEDSDASWPPGSVRWIQIKYMRAHATRLT